MVGSLYQLSGIQGHGLKEEKLIVAIRLLAWGEAVKGHHVHCSSGLGFHLWKEKKESCYPSLLLLSRVWEFWKESTIFRGEKKASLF